MTRAPHIGILACVAPVVAVLIDGATRPAPCESVPTLQDEFFRAIERMESLADTLQTHVRVDVTDREFTTKNATAPKLTSLSYEFACRGNRFLMRKEILDDRSVKTARISCKNDTYYFVIEQSLNRSELVLLQGLTDPGDSGADEIFRDLGTLFPVSSIHYVTEPLWVLAKLPGFEVLDMVELDDSMVRVEHTIPPDYDAGGPVYSDAYLVCDRSRGWSLMEIGHTFRFPDGTVDVLEFRVSDDSMRGDLVFINRRRTDLMREDESYRSSTEFTSTVLNDDPPLEMFYLSHYGLPEPSFDRPWSPLRISLLFLLLSVICVICWLMMSRRGRSPARAA